MFVGGMVAVRMVVLDPYIYYCSLFFSYSVITRDTEGFCLFDLGWG